MKQAFEEFINKNPKLKLSQFLKKEKIELTEIKQGPGLYLIFCKVKKKIYLGQSSNICRRLGDHWHTLNNNCHDCVELQNDWLELGSQNFSFFYLCVGSEWTSEKSRKILEVDLVESVDFFYNIGSGKKDEDNYKKKLNTETNIIHQFAKPQLI